MAALLVTNPNADVHKKLVYASMAAEATKSSLLNKIAVDVLDDMNVVPLQYNNYYLFSTTTLRGDRTSVGVLSRVWVTR